MFTEITIKSLYSDSKKWRVDTNQHKKNGRDEVNNYKTVTEFCKLISVDSVLKVQNLKKFCIMQEEIYFNRRRKILWVK